VIAAHRSILHATLLALLGALLCVFACDAPRETDAPPAARAPTEPQAAAGLGVGGPTNDGHYNVTLRPRAGSIPVNEMHAWTVDVTTAEGDPFRPTRLAFSGGMPQHQHGFVSEPRVTRALGPGTFLIEGVKFHMPGDWTLRVELVGPSGPDVVSLQLQVEP
jgi:hypothetical protein